MLDIGKPSREEILEAGIKLENGEELTDREIWILSEYSVEEADEFE